jgi:glycogen operon protein
MDIVDFQGVRKVDDKVEFCVRSPNALKVELCLFSDDEQVEDRIEMEKDENGNWHFFANDVKEGQKYGYRTYGEYNPSKRRFFNPQKLLVDPYAFEVTKSLHDISTEDKQILLGHNDLDSASVAPKSVVRFFDRETLEKKYPYLYKKPHIDWARTHIYELNVGNFSAQNPIIEEIKRGKLSALSDSVEYFKDLSYNQIELMPLTPTMADMHLLQEKGLLDQWGYNPINHHAIDPRYGRIDDLLQVINDMHKAGIEVCLDVVYNHTGESGHDRFLLSYKGLDADSYYRFSPHDGVSFVNTTGCGNGFNPNSKQGEKLIKDSLMFYTQVCGIDAFRFDLAGDCALDNNLQFDANGSFMKIVQEVADKTGAKMSGEPWSATGGYFLGQMHNIHEWNDKHEHALRKFLRGEHGQVGSLAHYMAGGSNSRKINVFTKHDGATGYDWATYHQKNNYENNENNRDGTDNNNYSPSSNDKERLTKTKSAHALNTLARGVPLSLSGDEIWHSQNGNNNGYARPFPIKWKELTTEQKDRYLFERKLNSFRQNHPAFSNIEGASAEIMPNGKPAWEWVNTNGEPMQQGDWNFQYNRFLGYVLNGQDKTGKRFDDDFFVMASGNVDGTIAVQLPPTPHKGAWAIVFDTSKDSAYEDNNDYKPGNIYHINPHSVVVMTCRRQEEKSNEKEFLNIAPKQMER